MGLELYLEVSSCDYTFEIDSAPIYDFEIGEAVEVIEGDPYEGPYMVIPNRETQVLYTNGKLLSDNVVVSPIPQNYGLITYDGSKITVS